MYSRRGFTLVELLIVVAILVLLLAVLLPALTRARKNAENAACKNNLRQIGLAMQMYVTDNGGRFPDWVTIGGQWPIRRLAGDADPDRPGAKPEIYGWSALLDRGGYLSVASNRDLWSCPAASERVRSYGTTYGFTTYPEETLFTLGRRGSVYAIANASWYWYAMIGGDIYSGRPWPSGEPTAVPLMVIPDEVLTPLEEWRGPHEWGGRGNIGREHMGQGRDRGALNYLFDDFHVGTVVAFNGGMIPID